MSKRKKRKRTPAKTAASPPAPVAEKEPPRTGWLRGGMQPRAPVDSPLPPLGLSVTQGLRTVLRQPLVLALAMLGTLGAWAAFASLGAELSPRAMVNLMALPPVHVYFDVLLVTGLAESSLQAGLLVLGIAVGRALLLGTLALWIVEAIRTGEVHPLRSLRALPRLTGILFLLFSIEIAAVLSIPVLVQQIGGPGLGLLGVLATMIFGLHFLGLTPAIAAAEATPAAETLRRSVRVARLPGPRHIVLVVAYFSFVFWAATITPTEAVAPATPTVLTWAFTLLASVLHVTALGAFAYRWLVVRDQLPPPQPRQRRR